MLLSDETFTLFRRKLETLTSADRKIIAISGPPGSGKSTFADALCARFNQERDAQSELGQSHDYFEGVKAFLEKRPANFKGE